MTRITQQQLESYLWGAAVLLRGTIDAGDYKQFIFPLLFYKRLCDVYDEETVTALRDSGGDEDFALFPENHRFQVPADSHWREVRKASRNVGRALQQAMRAIETANPDKLFGIFGDAQWTNKDRLSDAMLRDLIEHFSSLELTVANLPEDELGQGYEYLIKKFADDSGHTAAEFYTNRTVVHLMTEMLDVQPGESVYDPTCGSGGMLLSCIAHLRNQEKEWRNVKLYGQERNLMTSSIARMNCFLHGIEDFRIERGDTLAEPKLVEGDRLMQFDVVLANPPYSIKQWDRDAFASDPWGRNLYGTPPQGRADYAFQQHILQSLKPKSGRCAVLWPHGILFRKEEDEIRQKFIEADYIEAVIGLGPNLFYNSSMQSCVVVCRTRKSRKQSKRILFIDASNDVTRDRTQSFLAAEHLEKILNTYRNFEAVAGFATVASLDEIKANDWCLNIPLYVKSTATDAESSTSESIKKADDSLTSWIDSTRVARSTLKALVPDLACGVTVNIPQNPELFIRSLDRKSWRKVRLAEVCDEISIRVENPAASDREKFVGLEHFDSGELKIRRWGTTENLGSSMKAFASGDVLFARRNVYLKRASLADFDGLCSGDAIVLRERRDVIEPGFLAFMLNTSRFWEFAIANAAGTMSRRVNGKTLMRFEFDLPPLDQQRRIGEILWAVDEVIQRSEELHTSVLKAKDFFFDQELNTGTANAPQTIQNLGAALKKIVAGKSPKASNMPASLGKYGVLKVSAAGDGRYAETENKALLNPDDFDSSIEVKPGMILVTRCNAVLTGIGRACAVEQTRPGLMLSDKTLLLIPNDEVVDKTFLLQGLRSEPYRGFIERSANGTDAKNVSQETLKASPFWLPPISVQTRISQQLDEFSKAASAISKNIGRQTEFREKLTNTTFL